MSDVSVEYVPTPTLSRFLKCDEFVRCIVGPVGSGKSSACVAEVLRRALEQRAGPDGVRRTRFAVIRNTYGQLRDTTRKTFEQWIPPGLGTWNEQAFTFTMDFKAGDGTRVISEVLFRALDRQEDTKKLLSLELTGAYINESREISQQIFDVLQTRVGRFPSRFQGGPTWFGIWMDTNPWATSHWGYRLFSKEQPPGFALFEQPGGRTPQAENLENLPPRYYDRLVIGKDPQWVKSYVDGEYPAYDVGSVYGDLLEGVQRRGGMKDFEHSMDGVFTSWDLGMADATAIWFFQVAGGQGIRFIDHYESHGKPLSHYAEEINRRGYTYIKHWLPHDARAHTLATGTSVLEQLQMRFGNDKVAIGPRMALLDGIQAARWLLQFPETRFHPRCDGGVEALRAYSYEWDDDARVFSSQPAHNWASHTSDAFRYASVVSKLSGIFMPKDAEEADTAPRVLTAPKITLDALWKEHERGQAKRKRI